MLTGPLSAGAAPWQIAERDLHSQVWQKTELELDTVTGKLAPRPRSYVELGDGLNFFRDGQWFPSREEIELLPNGFAIARQGQTQVIFSPNANAIPTVDLLTPDSKRFRSRILGIVWNNPATGESELFAELKDSAGELVPPNQILYRDAFDGLHASIRLIYRLRGFEQDILLHENPPLPPGFDPLTARLQVWTEFFDPPAPQKHQRVLAQDNHPFVDERLHFGAMWMAEGKAFDMGASGGESAPCAKEWARVENRDFVIETLRYADVRPLLQRLPPQAAAAPRKNILRTRKELLASARRPSEESSGKIQLARVRVPEPALVWDYSLVSSGSSNFTFRGDSTYYVSSEASLYGTTTFEPGCVVKVTNGIAGLYVASGDFGTLNFLGESYRPVFFTAADDDSVGETISYSSGNPWNGFYGGGGYLRIDGYSPGVFKPAIVRNVRVSHAYIGIVITYGTGHEISHAQFVHCRTGIDVMSDLRLRNALLYNVVTNVAGAGASNHWEHVTSHLTSYITSATNFPFLTNCILASITNTPYRYGAGNVEVSSSVFQTVGAAAHYLLDNSLRNAGVTGINPDLAAALKRKTTFPPVVFHTNVTARNTNLVITPQVQRDSDGLYDLGFHYDPLDMLFGSAFFSNSIILITNGAAVGTFVLSPNTYGIGLGDNVRLFSEGGPTNLNAIVRYNVVAEQANTSWATYRGPSIYAPAAGVVTAPQVRFRFTQWSTPAGDSAHFRGDLAGGVDFAVPFLDCQFHGGSFYTEHPQVNVTNCLFERVALTLDGGNNPVNATFRHCTFFGGTNHFVQENVGTWTFQDNIFDGTGIYTNVNVTNSHNNNAYTTNLPRFLPVQVTDITFITTNVTYETGPLGRFYLPANSPTLNMGSTNATNVGLYHFTCTTNQWKETNSTADIGFHYVAVNGNNVAVDTDGDYLPDFLEDTDGDAIVDTGEFSWTSSLTFATNGLNDLQIWELSSNVQVNDPAQDTGSNTNTQFETTIVAFGNTVICAWVDSNLGVTGFGVPDDINCDPPWYPPAGALPRFIGWAVSRDGGVSFVDKGAPPPLTNIVNNTTNVLGDAGDPVLAWDTNAGIVYLFGNPKRPSVYYPDGTNSPAKIYHPLWRSTNNGETFLPPLDVMRIPAPDPTSDFFDKPAIAVDNHPGTGCGNVYLASRIQTNGIRRLLFNRAEQGGTNWSTNFIQTLGGVDAARPSIAVRTNHEVCLMWLETNSIMFAKSTNRGSSFETPVRVGAHTPTFHLLRSSNSVPLDYFGAAVIPTMAVNSASADIYIVYHDQATNIVGTPNIYLVQSTNAGVNWDPPIKVNSDGTTNHHWQPAITVKPDGSKLFIAWYDRRGDVASNSLIQIYGVFAGVPITTNSFTNNFLISTAQFSPIFSGINTNANAFDPVYPPIYQPSDSQYCGTFDGSYSHHMGDYDTAISDNNFVYYSWFDGRNTCTNSAVIRNQADVRTIRMSWPR